MTDDLERDLRDRFHARSLPAAPDRLRRRLLAVVDTPSVRPRPRFPQFRFVVAVTAMFALVATVPLLDGRLLAPQALVPVRSELVAGATAAGAPAVVWGPLAVANLDGHAQARAEGTLELTDRCAYLVDGAGERSLLVWPAARTSWDAQSKSVTLRRLQAYSAVTLSNGDAVEVDGGGSSLAEDGLSSEAWARRFEWAASPAPECSTEERWVVSEAAPLVTAPRSAAPTP